MNIVQQLVQIGSSEIKSEQNLKNFQINSYNQTLKHKLTYFRASESSKISLFDEICNFSAEQSIFEVNCRSFNHNFVDFSTWQDQKVSENDIYTVFEKHLYNKYFISMILKVTFGKKTHLINISDKPSINDLKNSINHIFKSLPSRYTLSYFDQDGDQITLQDQQDYHILIASNSKTAKVNIKEVNEQFMELTQKIQIEEQISEIREKVQNLQIQEPKQEVEVRNQPIILEVDQSLIEERLKKMLPEIISKVKSQISEQLSQRSRISNQPLITEDILDEEIIPKHFKKEKIEEPIIEEAKETIVVHKGVTCDNCHKRDIAGPRYKCSVCSNFDFCEECQATFQHPHSFLKIKNPKQAPIKIFTVINDEENNIEINGHKINASPGFEGLVNHGLNFFQNMLNRRGNHHQRINSQRGCPFKRNCWKNFNQETQMKPQQTKTEAEKKFEQKTETKTEKNTMKEQKRERAPQINEDEILNNAQYLASFGFEFDKCYSFARTYPTLSKENLLQCCLNQAGFLN